MGAPTAQEIAQQVLDRYASCTSYSDRGRYVCIHDPDRPPRSRHYKAIQFETRFVRPDRFYFEFLDEAVGPRETWHRFLIVQANGECRCWWSLKQEDLERDLRGCLAGATGVSGGTASTISSLLLPEIVKRTPSFVPAECERLNDVEIEGRAHWCLRGNPARFPDELFCIEPDTLIIRRITGRTEISPQRGQAMLEAARAHLPADRFADLERRTREKTETRVSTDQTDYTAAFDVELTDDDFRFEPG